MKSIFYLKSYRFLFNELVEMAAFEEKKVMIMQIPRLLTGRSVFV